MRDYFVWGQMVDKNIKNNIFITGAAGYVGRNLVNKLGLSNNNKIFALIRKPGEHFDKGIEVVVGDILNPASFTSVLNKCDLVFHCASYISFKKKDFQQAYEVNVEGTRNILEAANQTGVKKVVHLSACAVLGFSTDKNKVINENANPEITKDNVYAYTKKLAEEKVQKYVQKGLDISIANIATVYGQGDGNLNSGTIIKSIYEGKMRLIPPGGTSFVSVDDLIDGLLLLAQKGKAGERYIFCTENMEYKILFQRIAKTLNLKEVRFKLPQFTYSPVLLAIKCVEPFLSLTRNGINLLTPQILKETYGYKYFTSKKAREELGWKSSQNFEETVQKAFNYYKENNLI
ncbi:NAD-dependent epimerase/dehydratase family protein [Candidatus Kuenenia sp.]|uniref:NAD-dependent epimerase/dehydratase family protein n=1 Tax=Candidatus Kuenenia sp. TaxID=2499824 RepID=UPI00321FE13E